MQARRPPKRQPLRPKIAVTPAKVTSAKVSASRASDASKPAAKTVRTTSSARPKVATKTAAKPSTDRPAKSVAAAAAGSAKRSSAPVAPKDIAAKTVETRQSTPKKPLSSRHGFKTNEFVVYPAHGVGRIVGIEEQEIAGMSLELFVITFDKDKMTLRVPTAKLESVGMRKLSEDTIVEKAMTTLKGRARVKRTMWSRRGARVRSQDQFW